MKTYIILAMALIGGTSRAAAQDFSGHDFSGHDFTGPSVGVQGGWNETDVRLPGSAAGTPGVDHTTDAFVGGGFIAYDYQVRPRTVIGIQAEFNAAADDSFGSNGVARVRINPLHTFDITARAGYLVAPGTLVYVRGGYANSRVRTTVIDASDTRSTAQNRNGWIIGGGAERMIWNHVSARLEYRYSDLSDGPGKFDQHQVLLGVAYRF